MQFKKIVYSILSLTVVIFACYLFQDRKTGRGNDSNTTYKLVKDWPRLPDSLLLGNPTGIGIDTSQSIFIFHRAGREWPLVGSMPRTKITEKTILEIDRETGKIVNAWGNNVFIMPHGLTVDRDNNVWVTDVALQQVFKFTHEGKLLMRIGEANISGNNKAHFNRPTDVAVEKDGSFYVGDGYGNSRIVKFSNTGKYLFEWGTRGNKEGEFNIPHAIDLDMYGNVYVADRENSRIQVFNSTGKFIKQIANATFGNIYSVSVDKNDQSIFTIDDLTFLKIKHRGSDIFRIDADGTIQTRFGRSGSYGMPVCWYHDIAVDNQQNIYVGDILGNKIEKFKKVLSR